MNQTIISNFRVFLEDQHYSRSTIAGCIRSIKDLDDPPDCENMEALLHYVEKSLESMKPVLTISCYNTSRTALYKLFFFLTGIRIMEARKQVVVEEERNSLVDQYSSYCSDFLRLTPAVTSASVREVRLFVNHFSDNEGNADWSIVTADDIICFLSECRSDLRVSSLGVTVTAIRRYFRFLQDINMEVHPSVLTLPLSIPDWGKNGSLPKVLNADSYAALEMHKFPNTATGNRDRVVLLFFMELGLRCHEVSNLLLSDINWNRGSVVIRKTKTHFERELPISANLGEALEKYVMHYRPNNGPQLFFQTIQGRFKPATPETIRSIIRRIFEKDNISGWWIGTHAIRRSVGSRLYNAGNGLKTVSDMLGHASINTSKAYVRIDLAALKTMVESWPGRDAHE